MTATGEKEQQRHGDMYKALAHPLRREILAFLIEHSTGSPSQMARVLDVDVPDVSHHAKQLVKYGAAELVEQRPTRRGSPEHVYRPTARAILGTEEVEAMSTVDRQVFAGQIVGKVMDDLRKGFQVGSFARRADWALLHNLLDLDEEGFDQALKLQERVQEELFEIQAGSDARRIERKEPSIRVSASNLCFITNI
jgi:predicted ArsR family transcriptional regulator